MKQPRISVIVPMYNVEKFVGECLDSIVNQTFKDIEVIMVNDLSTDHTESIAKEYAEKYSNFTLITGKGKGLGGARNSALEIVKGEFCTFLDSDDVLPLNALEKLIDPVIKDNRTDLVIGNMVMFNEKQQVRMKEFDVIHKFEYSIDDIKQSHILIASQTACNKLFSMKIIRENKLVFPENLVHEDLYFTPIYYSFAKKITVIRDTVYLYRKFASAQTITSNINEQFYFTDRMKILDLLDEFILNKGDKVYKELIDIYKLNKFLIPFERKIYNQYTVDFSMKACELMALQLENISFETIEKVKVNKIEYSLLKAKKFDEYKEYKLNKSINLEANNGELYLSDKELPEEVRNVTNIKNSFPLNYKVEDIEVKDNIFTLRGYAFIEGINIKNDSPHSIQLAFVNRVNPLEKLFFNIKKVVRKDISFIYENRISLDHCGFEATLDLNNLGDLKENEYDIFIGTFVSGIERNVKLKINPKLYHKAVQYLNPKTLGKISNLSLDTQKHNKRIAKYSLVKHIDKNTTNSFAEIIESYRISKNEVEFRDNKVTLNFLEDRFNGMTLVIYNKNQRAVKKLRVNDQQVVIKTSMLNLISMLGWQLILENENGLKIKIETDSLINMYNLFEKYNSFLKYSFFQKRKSGFGWYILFLKLKGRVK